MQSITLEQRLRINRCQRFLLNEMAKSTERHCKKLFLAGMTSEAVEILADQRQITESQALDCLLTSQK